MDNFSTTQDFKFVSIAEIPIGARNHLPMDRVTLLNLNVISQTHWILRGHKKFQVQKDYSQSSVTCSNTDELHQAQPSQKRSQ